MKKSWHIISLVILIACVFIGISANAGSIVLTAVNDSFLPLQTNTMPTKKSSEWYVPYTVFNNFGIISYTQDDGDSLVMQTDDQTITFSLSQGYTYDKNLNTLSQPAYYINDTIYLPVKLMCGQFGLSFSVITGESLIVRICDQNAKLSDSDFIASTNQSSNEIVDDYKNESKKPEKPEVKPQIDDPHVPEPVPPEKPITPATVRPQLVYLMFTGQINEFSDDLLNTLDKYSVNATFFLPLDNNWNTDFVRKAISNGNTIGWIVNNEDDFLSLIDKSNERLFNQTGVKSRIIYISDDYKQIVDKTSLENQGYIIWTQTINAKDDKYNANRVYKNIINYFDKTTSPCVVKFQHEKSTNAALTLVLRDIKANGVQTDVITPAQKPIE